jgi:hypothetical protein
LPIKGISAKVSRSIILKRSSAGVTMIVTTSNR